MIPAWTEAFQTRLLTSIEGMIETANVKLQKVIEADIQKSTDYLEESLKLAETETRRPSDTVTDQDIKIKLLQKQQNVMSDRLLALELRGMSNNLVFSGKPEKDGESYADIRGWVH